MHLHQAVRGLVGDCDLFSAGSSSIVCSDNHPKLSKKYVISKLREEVNREIEKQHFLSGIARIMGGGGPTMPKFLALLQEMHFWSIKGVYFFEN